MTPRSTPPGSVSPNLADDPQEELSVRCPATGDAVGSVPVYSPHDVVTTAARLLAAQST